MKIGNINVGLNHQPFVIAEMSGNHNRSLDRALQIVDAAAEAGVHAIKLQTYTADTMTLNLKKNEFFISEESSLWFGRSLYDLYDEAHTPWEWHEPIFDRAREKGIMAFSTPFDSSAVDFLESLETPCYKIASFENTDLPLIQKVAQTGKPLILSTGMASVAELDEAIRTARNAGAENIILLKCTSSYPSSPVNSNLKTIPHLRQLFDCEVGLSDHTLGSAVAVASVALGATVIEKHFTLHRSDGGVDSEFSMEPQEFETLVADTHKAWQALGAVSYGAVESEKKSRVFRRSLYIVRDVRKGELLTRENVRCIRPGNGLPPKYLDIVIGRVAQNDLAAGTPLSWELC